MAEISVIHQDRNSVAQPPCCAPLRNASPEIEMTPFTLGFLLATSLSPTRAESPKPDHAKADEMIARMVYLLKYQYEDLQSPQEKQEETEKYKRAAISLSSAEYFDTRLFQIDEQLMMDNMATLGHRSGREIVEHYDEHIRQCRVKLVDYPAKPAQLRDPA